MRAKSRCMADNHSDQSLTTPARLGPRWFWTQILIVLVTAAIAWVWL